MTKLLPKISLSILFLLLLGIAPLAMAAFTCKDLNYQYGFTPTGPGAPEGGSGSSGSTTEPPASLADKLVVISEEPLGAPDNETTFNCARKIVCTGKKITPTSTDSKAPPASPSTPTLKRVCETTFDATSACSSTPKADIDKALAEGVKEGSTFTICEPVMVYLSVAGTNLLYYYIGQIYRYMATLGGIIAVLIMIVAGILRASAGDNSDRISKANGIITKCISGLVLLFLSAIILYAINPNFFVIK